MVVGHAATMVDPPARNKIFRGPRQPTRNRLVLCPEHLRGQVQMSGIIYLVGLVVIVMAILSFLGLR
jgi:hypothetical protein